MASADTFIIYIPPAFHDVKVAHAIFGPLVFTFLMPIGAILIRTLHHRLVVKLHTTLMICSWVLSFVALGTGIYIAFYIDKLGHRHTIIGFIVILGCALQPVTGWWHHVLYKRRIQKDNLDGKNKTSIEHTYKVTHMHVWWGRILITLGIINGGLGFQLARQGWAVDTSVAVEIGYTVGASVIWVVWMSTLIFVYIKNHRAMEARKSRNVLSKEVSSVNEVSSTVFEVLQSCDKGERTSISIIGKMT